MKKSTKIIINVHNSQALSRAVQEICFASGITWGASSQAFRADVVTEYGKEQAAMRIWGNGIQFASVAWYKDSGFQEPEYTFLDAKTDLGRLMDLLTEKDEIEKPTVYGYAADYIKGSDVIRFGCADLSVAMLRHINETAYNMTDIKYPGNRAVSAIVLDSGKFITFPEIKAILNHVDQVNK